MILNPGRQDGKTGMSYSSWSKTARIEITQAIRDAEASIAFKEMMSAHRIGGLCVRVAFLLLASVASFVAFWYGIVFIWQTYGYLWGISATLSAAGLSIAFVFAGLVWGSEEDDDKKREVEDRYAEPDAMRDPFRPTGRR